MPLVHRSLCCAAVSVGPSYFASLRTSLISTPNTALCSKSSNDGRCPRLLHHSAGHIGEAGRAMDHPAAVGTLHLTEVEDDGNHLKN